MTIERLIDYYMHVGRFAFDVEKQGDEVLIQVGDVCTDFEATFTTDFELVSMRGDTSVYDDMMVTLRRNWDSLLDRAGDFTEGGSDGLQDFDEA